MTGDMENKEQPQFSGMAASTAAGMLDLLNHIDGENSTRANALVGICAILLAFALPRLQVGSQVVISVGNVGWLVIALGAVATLANSVFAFKPSTFSPKKKLTLFYPGSYLRRFSEDEYFQHLTEMFRQDSSILKEFSHELYNYGGIVTLAAKRVERSVYILAWSLILGVLLTVEGAFF